MWGGGGARPLGPPRRSGSPEPPVPHLAPRGTLGASSRDTCPSTHQVPELPLGTLGPGTWALTESKGLGEAKALGSRAEEGAGPGFWHLRRERLQAQTRPKVLPVPPGGPSPSSSYFQSPDCQAGMLTWREDAGATGVQVTPSTQPGYAACVISLTLTWEALL